jgi:putative endonuclease
MSGAKSYHAGLAAEAQVALHYERAGMVICARRWRGKSGEIDLIARDGAKIIFIEVKQSRTHATAASHLSDRQVQRIYLAASEYVENEPLGQLTEVQLDAALVDAQGQIQILANFAA